ncbi:MAG: (d)CMP kinase [Rhodobacteraceae bacterium]|nr:(d)CMP kinase [Paracoccaceae bacterium]
MKFTVAIDGPAAAGKGTIARLVAAEFGFAHLDTGLLYRAVGRKALTLGRGVIEPEQAVKIAIELSEDDINRDDLRTARVAQAASKVAVLPKVRAALLQFQQDFARREGGAILDGRDIGTVICPAADVKLFVTASDRVRADRRFAELLPKSPDLTLERVRQDLMQRDLRDASRDIAPMKPANDALMLDTTNMTIDAAVQAAIDAIKGAKKE